MPLWQETEPIKALRNCLAFCKTGIRLLLTSRPIGVIALLVSPSRSQTER
jgi:hypothetical protein